MQTQENVFLHKSVILQLLCLLAWASRDDLGLQDVSPHFLSLQPATMQRNPKNKNQMQLAVKILHEEGLATFLTTILFINLFQINRVWYCTSNLDLHIERIDNDFKSNSFPQALK